MTHGRETVEKQYIETGKKGGMDEEGRGRGGGGGAGGLEMSEAGWQGCDRWRGVSLADGAARDGGQRASHGREPVV